MHWTAKALLCLFLPYLLVITYQFLARTGLCVQRVDHAPGPCRVVSGIDCGAEDIEATSDGLAFISSGYHAARECGGEHRGQIYLFDFTHPDSNVTALNIISKNIDRKKFEPHGIGIHENEKTGDIRLFVVDHSEMNEVVRIFSYNREEKYTLRHFDDVRDGSFKCLNDVQPTGPRSFYVTNYLRFCHYLGRHRDYEILLQFVVGMSNIVHFNGNEGRVMVSGLKSVNGIKMSLDKKFIFGATIDGLLHAFKRDAETNVISCDNAHTIPIKTMGDNINVDAAGDLYIGGFPHAWMTLLNDFDGPNATPAQVVRVHPTSANWSSYEISEPFYNSGINFVRGTSSAYHYNGQLLMGTPEHLLGYCLMETMY